MHSCPAPSDEHVPGKRTTQWSRKYLAKLLAPILVENPTLSLAQVRDVLVEKTGVNITDRAARRVRDACLFKTRGHPDKSYKLLRHWAEEMCTNAAGRETTSRQRPPLLTWLVCVCVTLCALPM